jgi:hypothetical protein
MKRLFAGLRALALLSLISYLTPVQAQTSVIASSAAGTFGYDASGEITLNGTVAAGHRIELAGAMTSNKDKQAFPVRTARVGGEVNAIRNEHGFPMTPQARERASQTTAGTSL